MQTTTASLPTVTESLAPTLSGLPLLVHASVEYLDHMRGYRSQTKYLKRTVLQPEELKARAVRQAREACLALA